MSVGFRIIMNGPCPALPPDEQHCSYSGTRNKVNFEVTVDRPDVLSILNTYEGTLILKPEKELSALES